jgi:hypothetical protein
VKIGKVFLVIIVIAVLIASCSTEKDDAASEETILPVQEIVKGEAIEERITQNENPLLSSYSEGPNDGYSWRKREIKYDRNTVSLSKEVLVSTIWVRGISDGYNTKLIFYLDDIFRMGTNQAGVESEGNYRIIDDKTVELTFIRSSYGNSPPPTPIQYTFRIDPNEFWEQHCLYDEINNNSWRAYGSKPPIGSVVNLNDINVMRENSVYVVLENVKFRTGPGIEFNAIDISKYIDAPINGSLDYLPAGEKLYIEAITVEKTQISEWLAPWYYVRYPVYHDYVMGWVFGEFLEPYDDSKEETYKKRNNEEWKKIYERDTNE